MTEGVESDNFDFYLKFAKPLVLNLPDPNERVLAAAWVKKLRDETTGSESVRKDYLKLLLFSLNRKKLTAPFSQNPVNETLKDLQRTNEILEIAKDIIFKEDSDRKAGLAGGDYPPYSTECSADLLEYAAAQDIPKFGVHAYYALSFEPITKWDNAEKGVLPKGIVPESLQKSIAAASSVPEVGTTSETIATPKKTPKTSTKQTPAKSLTETETSLRTPKKPIASDSPLGSSPPIEDRSPVTWGSNLLDVLDLPGPEDNVPPSLDDTAPSLPYLTPTRQLDFPYVEAPSLPYRTPTVVGDEPTTDEECDSFAAVEADDSFAAAEALFSTTKGGDFMLDDLDMCLPDSPLRSPGGTAGTQYKSLLTPRKSPARAATPQAAAEAQYASLISPRKSPAHAAGPQAAADAQYAALFSPDGHMASPVATTSRQMMSPATPRPRSPQYSPGESPGEAAAIPRSRSLEANAIIAEVNASLQQLEPSPTEYRDQYYGHKRRDMPATPPAFSRDSMIRLGPGRDTVYEQEQFGISAGEAWHPGADFRFQRAPPGTTPVKPSRRQYDKKAKPLEVVFPRLHRDDWSEVFFEAQIPDLIDDTECDDGMEISAVPEEDLDKRIKKLLGDIRDSTQDSPAAAGVAATTPKSTGSPIRIHPYGTDFPLFEVGMPEYFSPESSPTTKAAEQYAELMGSPRAARAARAATPPRAPTPPKPKTPSPVRDPHMDDLGLPHLIFEKPKTPEQAAAAPAEKSPAKKAESPKKEESKTPRGRSPPKSMNELQAVVDAQYADLYEKLVADEPVTKSPIAGPSTARSPTMSPKTPPPPSPGHYPPTVNLGWETPPHLKIDKAKTPTPPSPFMIPEGLGEAGMLFQEGPPGELDLLNRTPPSPPTPMSYDEYVEQFEPFLRPDEDFYIEEDVTTLGPLLETHDYEPYDPRTSIRLQIGNKARRIPISSRRARTTDMTNISEEPEFTYLPSIDVFSPPPPRRFTPPRYPSPAQAAVQSPGQAAAAAVQSPVKVAAAAAAAQVPSPVAGTSQEQAAAISRDVISDARKHFVSGFENENIQNMLHRVLDIVDDVEDVENIFDVEGLQRETEQLPTGSPSRTIAAASPPRVISEFEEIEQAFGATPPRPKPPTPPPPLHLPEFGFQGQVSDFMAGPPRYLLPFQREGYVMPEVDVGKSPKKLTPPRRNIFGEIVDYEIPKRPPFGFLQTAGSPESPVYLVGDEDDTNLAQGLIFEEPIVSPRPKVRTPGRTTETPPRLPIRPTRITPVSPPTPPDVIDFILSTATREPEPYYQGDRQIRQGNSGFMNLPRYAGSSAVPSVENIEEVPDFYDEDDIVFIEEVGLAHETYPWARQRRKKMNVLSGRRNIDIERKSRPPVLHTVTEELDHIPTPSRMQGQGARIRRRRRLDFDMENPDADTEPPKVRLPPYHRFEPGEPLPPKPLPGQYSPEQQQAAMFPPEMFGVEANVPLYNRETLIDMDNIPMDLPPPIRYPVEIAGWQTPPHLKTPPRKPPEQPRFTDDFVNFMSYEIPPEEYLTMQDLPDEPVIEDDVMLSTALPFFVETQRSPTADQGLCQVSPPRLAQVSPPKVFGRADTRTGVPRAPSPTMKKTVKTVVQCPSGTETTSTTITETAPHFPTPPPPVAQRSMTPSPRMVQLQQGVLDTADAQYAALLDDTLAPQVGTPPPGPSRQRTPQPGPSRQRTPQPGPSWRRTPSPPMMAQPLMDTPKRSVTKTTTISTTTPKSKVKRKIIEEVVSPTTPRDYDVMSKPSPYWTGQTPEATPPAQIHRHIRPPSPLVQPMQSRLWDDLPHGIGLGEELEPMDLMPIGSPVSPLSTRAHMQDFVANVRKSDTRMVKKSSGYGERERYNVPGKILGPHRRTPFLEEPEHETDDYFYWPGPYDPKSQDLSKFAPKHLKYTQIEDVEAYEPPAFSPLRRPDPNMPLVERAEYMVADVPEPEDLECAAFSPHVAHVFQTPPPPSPKFPRLQCYTEQLEEMEFPEDDILLSPRTPPGIPSELRRRSPGTPLGTPPWQIPAELMRRTPGTPLGTPPFRGDRFEGACLEEGSPLAFYGSPIAEELQIIETTSPQRSPRASPQRSPRTSPRASPQRSPGAQGYSPGTAAEIASVRLQAHALGGAFQPHKRAQHKVIKKRKLDLRRVPETEEPPYTPHRRMSPGEARALTPRNAAEVQAAADAQYAALLSPPYFRDPRFEIMSPPGVIEQLPTYEKFDPEKALEKPKDAYDQQFDELARVDPGIFLTGSPVQPVFADEFEENIGDQFTMIAAEGDDDFLGSPQLYISPEMPDVDPFVQSIQEHELPQCFSDPLRPQQVSKMVMVGRKGMRLPRNAPRPRVHDIREVSEEPLYSGRLGVPTLYPTGTPQSAIAHYTPPLLAEQPRFEERAPFRKEYIAVESELYGEETPGMLDYYEQRHEPRPPLTRRRLFDDYEDSPSPQAVRMSPAAMAPARVLSPQAGYSGALSPQARMSPAHVLSPAVSHGTPENPFSISGFSEQFGYTPRASPDLVEEITEEQVIYEDSPGQQVTTTHYNRHVSPRMVSPQMGLQQRSPVRSPHMGQLQQSPGMEVCDERAELYQSFEDYGEVNMFGGDLQSAILDTSDIPPETECEYDGDFDWLN